MKVCPQCRETKALDEYHRDRGKPDGRHAYCKPCRRERYAEYYATHGRNRTTTHTIQENR